MLIWIKQIEGFSNILKFLENNNMIKVTELIMLDILECQSQKQNIPFFKTHPLETDKKVWGCPGNKGHACHT